ncbi:thiamine pyrophosphate-binding protein [Jatrophihabitans sp. DSM 45814]
MHVYEYMSRTIVAAGVSSVFALLSEDTALLVSELGQSEVEVYGARHEAAAVGMADGYSRSTRSLGIAIIGRGPGFTNALTAIVSAAKGRSSLLVIVGDAGGSGAPTSAKARGPKYLDQSGVLAACGVPFRRLDAARPEESFAEAVEDARRGAATVLLVPSKAFDLEVEGDVARTPQTDAPMGVAISVQLPDVDTVAAYFQEGWTARRPIILAGKGVLESDARAELIRLADRTGALLSTTLLANSLFAGDDYDIGIVGTFSTDAAAEVLADCDLLLAFGTSLNPFTTYAREIIPKAMIIQVDSDPQAFGRYVKPELEIQADAKAWAGALADELEARGYASAGYRTVEVSEMIKRSTKPSASTFGLSTKGLDPRVAMIELEQVIPKQRTLVMDPGQHITFSCPYLSVPTPQDFIFPVDFGSVGSAAALAYGAAVAQPSRLTVLCIGDGGMMMSLSDLETAVRYGLNLLIVISNDSGFGAEMQFLRLLGKPDDVAKYPSPDFAALARALGARGLTVQSLEDIGVLKDELQVMNGPVVVDLKVRDDVRPDWADFLWRRKVQTYRANA